VEFHTGCRNSSLKKIDRNEGLPLRSAELREYVLNEISIAVELEERSRMDMLVNRLHDSKHQKDRAEIPRSSKS
jgi:hypothetical protein